MQQVRLWEITPDWKFAEIPDRYSGPQQLLFSLEHQHNVVLRMDDKQLPIYLITF